MKHIVSFLMLLSSIVGVLTISEEFCLGESGVAVIMSHDHDESSSHPCHHADGTCHQCHLGHCAFELPRMASFRMESTSTRQFGFSAVGIPTDHGLNLFRPPII